MSLPFIRLYPQDYLQDTNHLTTEEHGAYLLLILNYWQTEKPLPDDNKRLAGICRADAKQWLSIRLALSEFFDISEGVWRHHRIDSELLHVSQKSAKAKRAGKKGGLQRAENIKEGSNRSRVAQVSPSYTDTDTDTDTLEKKGYRPSLPVNGAHHIPYEKIKDLYHEILPNHPKVKILTPARKSAIKQRHLQDMDANLETWADYFRFVGQSKFLTGRTEKPYYATLEWVTKQNNYAKIYEGNYHDK